MPSDVAMPFGVTEPLVVDSEDDVFLQKVMEVLAAIAPGPKLPEQIPDEFRSQLQLPGTTDNALRYQVETELVRLCLRVDELESTIANRSSSAGQNRLDQINLVSPNDMSLSSSDDESGENDSDDLLEDLDILDSGASSPRRRLREDGDIMVVDSTDALGQHTSDNLSQVTSDNTRSSRNPQSSSRALPPYLNVSLDPSLPREVALERELWRAQKSNQAFKRALGEIGEILAGVARGDLTKAAEI